MDDDIRHVNPLTRVPAVAAAGSDAKRTGLLDVMQTFVNLQRAMPWKIFPVEGGGGGATDGDTDGGDTDGGIVPGDGGTIIPGI